MQLFQIENDKIQKDEAKKVFQTVFSMCTLDIINAFAQIGYFGKALITSIEYDEVYQSEQKQADLVIEKIFDDREEILQSLFRGVILENLPWILTPHEIFLKITSETKFIPEI